MRKLRQQKNTGFTLLEMIVAIGVFIVVVTISLSAFLNVHDIQLKMSAFRAANDNINFAIETMVRDIEEGRCSRAIGSPDTKCGDGSNDEIKFYTFNESDEISYKRDFCAGSSGNKCIKRKEGVIWSNITSDNVNITYLNFEVSNSNLSDVYNSSGIFQSGDNKQPLITITVEGVAGDENKPKLQSKINVQASVSQRQLDAVYQ